jgi:3-methyladenine DNA glycosylase AlkD
MYATIKEIRAIVYEQASLYSGNPSRFFKTGIGGYAAEDKFIGVSVPVLRQIAKKFDYISLSEVQELLASAINEERLLALFILVRQFANNKKALQEEIYQLYLANLRHINNWNLVDSSAHQIVGAHVENKDRMILLKLAKSTMLWERRIAIIATWHFIRKEDFDWTWKIAEVLLDDKEDLIHKAVGWMLRELGKRNPRLLLDFLELYAARMPRTMLRYAIEKLSINQRKAYLLKKLPQ